MTKSAANIRTIARRKVSVSAKQFSQRYSLPFEYAKQFVQEYGFKTGTRYMLHIRSMSSVGRAATWLYRSQRLRSLMRTKYIQKMQSKRLQPKVVMRRCILCGAPTERIKYCTRHRYVAHNNGIISPRTVAYYRERLPEPEPPFVLQTEAATLSGRSARSLKMLRDSGALYLGVSHKIAPRNGKPMALYAANQMIALRSIPKLSL